MFPSKYLGECIMHVKYVLYLFYKGTKVVRT